MLYYVMLSDLAVFDSVGESNPEKITNLASYCNFRGC